MTGDYWDEQEAMIGEELARREKKESKMSTTEINWRHNCLTVGPHDGRWEAIWTMPLLHAARIFRADPLKELVIARIYNDAMQMVEYGDEPRMPKTWADQTKEYAENWFLHIFQNKIGELVKYYASPHWERDVEDAVEQVKADKLNPGYAPLHPHDSINMLCRIIGSQASREASKDIG